MHKNTKKCPTCTNVVQFARFDMLKMEDLLKNKFKFEDLSEDIKKNLTDLLEKINKVQEKYNDQFVVTSGLRSEADQQRINPSAPKSNHLRGLAVDIYDAQGTVMRFILANLDLMKDLGLYFEHFNWTPDWVHVQSIAPKSGKRIFIPSSQPALCARWDSAYEHKKYDD